MKKLLSFVTIIIIFITCSCSTKKAPYFREVKVKNVVFTDDMGYDGLLKSIEKSLEYYGRFSNDKEFNFGDKKIKKIYLEQSLKAFAKFIEAGPSVEKTGEYIKNNFYLYSPVKKGEKKPFLFTGYYEPELSGSLEKTEEYKYPLYLIPENLLYVDLGKFSEKYDSKRLVAMKKGKRVVPYYTHEEIAFNDSIKEEAEVLAWLDNRIDLFFLQIQGSGKVYLKEGGVLRVHYAGNNGHAYRSIGKYLIDKNRMTLENMSMQNLKKYLEDHPEELKEILSYNESYVFFEKVDGGPYGALSKELTPGRSLASDLSIYPRGGLVYVDTEKPVISGDKAISYWRDLKRFMVIQDTGGAIKGYFRGDIFFGCGEYAETAAGHLAKKGNMYILIPRDFGLQQ